MGSNASKLPRRKPLSVLFVCMGNTSRSCMAEAILRTIIHQQTRLPFAIISSAGLHVAPDVPPHADVQKILRLHGVRNYRHEAKRVTKSDLKNFEWIFAMDEAVLAELETLKEQFEKDLRKKRRFAGQALGVDEAKLTKPMLIGSWRDGKGKDVRDPIFKPLIEVQEMYNQLSRLCNDFVSFLAEIS